MNSCFDFQNGETFYLNIKYETIIKQGLYICQMELKKKNESEFLKEMNNMRTIPKDKYSQVSETGRSQSQNFNTQYYQQFKRLFLTSYYLSLQMKQALNYKEEMWNRLAKLQKKTEEFKDSIRGEAQERKKRNRRTAEEIQRKYICSVEKCQKCYGSEGSLQQHIKLKHPQLYVERPNLQSNSNINLQIEHD